MNDTQVLDYSVQALLLTLAISMPVVVVAVAVGLLVSLFQSLTQLQDQTLSFAVRLVAVAATLALTLRWMGSELVLYADRLFSTLPALVR